MRVHARMVTIALALLPALAAAQHAGGAQPLAIKAPKEASQFDFLVGQWDLVVKPKAMTLAQKVHGMPKLVGTWKAWRAFEGWGIEDDLRIVDASGNPMLLTHYTRVYDAAAKHWSMSALDVFRQHFTASVAQWQNGEMLSTAEGIEPDGSPHLTRSHLHAITANAFTYTQDKSTDGGKTWIEGNLVIEAKRTAANAAR